MCKTMKLTGSLTAFALAALLLAAANADDVKGAPKPADVVKAFAEFATPGAEHAKLQPLAGNWTYTCKVWFDPANPPIETTGTIERKWILGGRFLEERVAGTGFDGKPGFEAFGLIGYDNAQKKYTMTWACTMGTNVGSSVGVSDAPGNFTFQATCYCPLEQKNVSMRDELRIESEDKNILKSFRVDDGSNAQVMEIVAVRKK